MDKCDNRHRLSFNGRSTSPAKTCHEVNGSGQEFSRKAHSKKKVRKNLSHTSERKDWLKESVNEFQPGGCWLPSQGQQRLFTAVSDPAVCGYPMSLSYSIDQFSLPMIPVYPLAPKIPYKPSVPSGRKFYNTRNHDQEHPCNDEFTSLPPVNLPDFESDHQRRFSDPGLANGPLSDEESGSGNESDGLSSNESHLVDRLSQVIKDNKRLETELQETKLLLQELKIEVSEMKVIRSSYEPGVVCDLVREVRESMKIHQEAFLSRIQETHSSNGIDKAAKDSDDLKQKLKEVTSDRDALHERLMRLEEQVKTVMVHNSVHQSNQEELVSLEREKIQLRRELQEAVDARKVAEAKVQNFEQLLNVLQKKVPNGLIVEEKCRSSDSRERESGRGAGTSCNNGVSVEGNHNAGGLIIGPGGGAGGGPSSGESLMSSFSSGSLHSPHVTMSGPVTDL